MSTRPRSLRAAATLAAAVLLASVAGAAARAEETRSFEKSFPLGATTLRLANLAGAVELTAGGGAGRLEAGSGGAVRVEVTVHAEGRDAAETRALLDGMQWVQDRDQKGREIWALSYPVKRYDRFHYPTEKSESWFGGFGSRTSTTYLGERVSVVGERSSSAPTLYADLKITMPAGADLGVRNAVGPIHGGELAGRLDLDTGSGDVDLAAFDGPLAIDTGSGDVRVGRVAGDTSVDTGSGDVNIGETGGVAGDKLDIDTGSGDVRVGAGKLTRLSVDTGSGSIRVTDLDAETFKLDTGSGDVTLRSPLVLARTVTVDTGSGDVEIYGGADASFRVAADQGSGRLDVRYADAELIRDRREVVGARRGDGRTRIDVDTGSGDCVIAPGR